MRHTLLVQINHWPILVKASTCPYLLYLLVYFQVCSAVNILLTPKLIIIVVGKKMSVSVSTYAADVLHLQMFPTERL